MANEYCMVEVKDGRSWVETYRTENPENIQRRLCHDLIAGKLHHAGYVKRITDKTNYDGTRTIRVLYDNDARATYRIKF